MALGNLQMINNLQTCSPFQFSSLWRRSLFVIEQTASSLIVKNSHNLIDMVKINYVIGYCLVFLSLAFLSLADEENIHDPASIDARHILFGRPIMSIPASALPPGYLPAVNHRDQQPAATLCHSMDAQYPGQPCSPSLYSTPSEPSSPASADQTMGTAIPSFLLLNLFGHRGNRFVMPPDFHRYPFANNNQFRQESQFPTIPEEDVPSQYT